MSFVEQLVAVAETFAIARGLSISRVSTLAFGDGKIIDRLRAGSDMTTGRFESGMQWFSDNWPAEAVWPGDIGRPTPKEQAA